MMMSMKRFVQAGFIAGLLASGPALAANTAATTNGKPAPTTVDTSGPSQLIESSANILLADIDKNREAYRKDPTGLYKTVSQTLLPNFDTAYAAQLVLGPHWRNASAEQRKRFVDAFYNSLLYTYGDAMIDFTANRLKVFPTKVAVNYTLRKVNGEWKAWDVVIDGISYVKSYREDYGAQVDQQGMDAVIKRLESRAQTAKAAKVKKT